MSRQKTKEEKVRKLGESSFVPKEKSPQVKKTKIDASPKSTVPVLPTAKPSSPPLTPFSFGSKPAKVDDSLLVPAFSPRTLLTPVKGKNFISELGKVMKDKREASLLDQDLQVTYPGKTKDHSTDYRLHKSYYLMPHSNKIGSGKKESVGMWDQGWMHGNSQGADDKSTKWKVTLPQDLGLEEATNFGRALKGIMDVSPKPMRSSQTNAASALDSVHKPATAAATSFAEDVTGFASLGVAQTGSAIRAAYMAAKYQMKNAMPDELKPETASPTLGFKTQVMNTLTQLRKDGAAKLVENISKSEEPESIRQEYSKGVTQIHAFFDEQVQARYEKKLALIKAIDKQGGSKKEIASKRAAQVGQWWKNYKPETHAVDAYQDRKRERHAIMPPAFLPEK
jgi:hypothetical protein